MCCIYWHNSTCGGTAKTVAWKIIWQVLQTLYVPWKSANPLIYVLSRDDIPFRWDFPLSVNTEICQVWLLFVLFCQFCTVSSACTFFEQACKLAGIQGTWAFKYSGMWRHVTGKVVPNILKDYSAFIFKVKQCKKTSLKVEAPWSLELLAQWYRRLVSSATQLWKLQISFGVHTTWVFSVLLCRKDKTSRKKQVYLRLD